MRHTIMLPQHAMIDDMIAQFFGNVFNDKKTNSKYPLTNVYYEDGVAYMEIAVAGFSKEDISITIDNDTLTIKGVSRRESPETRKYIKRDIAFRSFEKSYSLMFDVERVDAEVKDGLLIIKLIPYIPVTKTPIEIEIK